MEADEILLIFNQKDQSKGLVRHSNIIKRYINMCFHSFNIGFSKYS